MEVGGNTILVTGSASGIGLALADLGQGVLDSAMVETAAYCLEKEAVSA